MKALLLLNLLLSALSIIPNWNLKNCSKNLLTTDSYTYIVTDREMYNLIGILNKTIERKPDNSITHKNTLYITNKDETTTLTFNNVNFENIESLYKLEDGRRIVCPMGKHHPINIDNLFQENDNTDIDDNNEWDLKCYNHNEGYFFIYYFMNGEKQVYDLLSTWGYTKLDNLQMFHELYDFKLVNKDTNKLNGPYPICALIKIDNSFSFFASEYNFGESITRSPDKNRNLTSAKTNIQGYFNNYTNHFYFITYDDISDFISGFSTVANDDGSNLYRTNRIEYTLNSISPFEFSDVVEIKEMKFLLYTHYVYYTIYNTITQKTYHGVLNVKLNKIVFNTEEDINVFIPYSNNSMLAITPDSAYRICLIPDSEDEDNCLESCPDNSYLILDIDGNKCSSSTVCGDGKYTLLPEGVCISVCDTTIFVIQGTNCGLCRDLDNSKKYKIINSTVCLSDSEIPDNSAIYDPNFYLIKCNNGNQLSENGKNCIPHCYPTCETCSDYSLEENDQKCLTCNDSYYFENNKCLPKIPTTIPKTIPKIDCNDEKCLTCNEESNRLGLCLTCNEEEGYIKVNYTIVWTNFFDCMKKENPKLKSYYYNETLKEYRPCYKTCKRCLKAGNAKVQNCLECENNFMFRPGDNPYNNCVAYSEFYFISSYNQYKSLDVYQCPEEAKYYIKEKKSCIDDCKKDKDYKYLYNGNCYKECPSNTEVDNTNYLCTVSPNKCVLGTNDIYLKENDNLEILGALVKSYISEFYYTSHYVSLYQNKLYSILIYKDSNCIKELALEMPNVNFQSCYAKVQQAYGITEDLIIVIVDKKESSNPTTFYSFYHPKSGLKLNADEICKEESIKVTESLTSLLDKNDNTKYEIQTSLTSQGINIFDLNDPFYNDICYDFDNPLKKDIPLNDRIKEVFPNVTLCDEGCQYSGINLEEMTATCDCKFNDIANSNLVKDNELLDSAFGEVLDLINSSNILVFKCFKYMFKHFAKSIGGWISLVLLISHITMTLLFIFFGIPNIKMYIFSLTQNYINFISKKIRINQLFPPKRNIKNQKQLNIISKKIPEFKENNSLKKNKFGRNSQINQINRIIEVPSYSKDDIVIKLAEQNKTKESEDINVNTEMELNQENIKLEINPEKYDKNFFEEYMKTSLNDLEFDDAVVLDKRKYCEHMRENLLEDQIIANTFITEDPIKPRSIKIILFGLNIILYFVVNGLFFSEEVISELYNVDEDEENFFSFFPRSIERLIYTTIVSIVVGMIADFFFINENKIKGIFRREKDDIKNLKRNIIELVSDLKKRYFAFIIIVSVILVISFFYLLCFNYVYPYTQIEWIKSSITIMIIMQILSTLKCILETSLRFLSYKFKNEKLYKISKILD